MENEIFETSYVKAKLSQSVQINKLTPLETYRGYFENQKGPRTSFQISFFTEFFDKEFFSAILHELLRLYYQTVFTSQVIQ